MRIWRLFKNENVKGLSLMCLRGEMKSFLTISKLDALKNRKLKELSDFGSNKSKF